MKNIYLLTMLVLLKMLAYTCTANTVTSNKTFTVNTWSGAWTFTGFAIGPSSGEYYNLLSSSVEGQCALVRETASGNVTWSKLYTTDQCAGLSVDSSETYVYFASNNNAAYFGVNQVLCSTGESNNYFTSTFANISSGGVANIDAKGNPGYVVLAGNVQGSGNHECIFSWGVSGTSFAFLCSSSSSKYFGAFAIPDAYCYGSRSTSNNRHSIVCTNVSDSSTLWFSVFNFSNTFSSELMNFGKMDSDGSNVYCAFEPDSSSGIFLITFNIADGSYVDIIRQRQSSNQLKIGSVQATGSCVVYVSVYSSNSAYTELIKFNVSSTDYTIYQQTGLDFRLQYINTALSDCWYGLLDTQYIHYTQLSAMDEVAGLTVASLTNTGLTDVDNSNSTGGASAAGAPLPSSSFVTTTTNVAAAFNVSITVLVAQNNTTTNNTSQTNTTQTNTTTTSNNTTTNNSDDDSLGIVPIVLIIIGCVVVIVIGIGTVLSVIKCRKKSRDRRLDVSRVETPADETNVLKEENKI